MEEPMEIDTTPVAPFDTLHILKLIKDSQQKHGLRHSDYKRYSDYCARRIRRLRKSLKFTNVYKCVPKHRAKFQPRKLSPEDDLKELRFVELLVYQVEHCWARGMEFKFASEDEVHDRQKFHARLRLGKALQHAQNLDAIAKTSPKVNSLTKLEAQAYFNYISATFYFEKKQWQKALENYRQSKSIYMKLSKIAQDSYVVTLYDNRCNELTNMIGLCEKASDGGASEVAEDISELKLKESSMDIEKLVADAEATLPVKEIVSEKPELPKKEESKKKKPSAKKVAKMSKFFPTKPLFFDLALERFKLPSQVAAIASTPETQDKSGEQSGGLGTLKNLLWGGGSK